MTLNNAHSCKVSIITLNWNGKDDTLECVASLKKLNHPNYDIVVVDNGSTDGSVSTLRARYPDVTVIENGRNLGYALGFNTGLNFACEHGADYFLILNNDTIIDPDALAELVKAAQQDDRIGFVTGKVYSFASPDTFQTTGRHSDPETLVGGLVGLGEVDRGQYDCTREYDFVDDVFLLVRREVYETVGGYDPNFFLYYEETDWCARVRKAGFKIMYTPYAKIWHKGRTGGPSTAMSPIRHYYMCRNEILFMKRNGSPVQFRQFLLRSLRQQPLIAARLVRHGKFPHALARLRGIGSGLSWLLHERSSSRA